MECILLGSGGMMPMPGRLLTSLVVRLQGRMYLFDAGEATQLGLKSCKLGVRALQVIAISHLHADHCLGLPGLLMLRAQLDDPGPLTVLGPQGIQQFVFHTHQSLAFYLNYDLAFIEWHEGSDEVAYEDEQVRIRWLPMKHTRLCLGYRLEEKERPGKFKEKAAEKLGVPRGPLWGNLQRGETVILADGTKVEPGEVLGPQRQGRRVAYVVDTRPNKNVYRLCHQVDLAFVEGMFLPEEGEQAMVKGHLTVTDASRICARAGVRRLVVVHLSPRYSADEVPLLAAAAKSRFPEAEIGSDFQVYRIDLRDDKAEEEIGG